MGPLELLVVLIILSPIALIVWLIVRSGRRKCSACGTKVKAGPTACPYCGQPFAAAR